MKRGFTIIELIVACFIIVMGILAVSRLMSLGHRGGTVSKDRMLAIRLARNVIDKVRSMPFGADPSSLRGPVPMLGESVEGKAVGLEFNVDNVTVAVPSGSTPVGFGTITVTVSWHQGVGQTNSAGNNSLTMTGGLSRDP